jgi:hypothetical protein
MVLVAASFVWPSFAGGNRAWTEEDAKSYQQAAAQLHRLHFEAAKAQDAAKENAAKSNPQASFADKKLASVASNDKNTLVDPSSASADRLASELEAAKKKYEEQRAALDSARSRGGNISSLLFWAGLAAAAAGLISLATTAGDDREV